MGCWETDPSSVLAESRKLLAAQELARELGFGEEDVDDLEREGLVAVYQTTSRGFVAALVDGVSVDDARAALRVIRALRERSQNRRVRR